MKCIDLDGFEANLWNTGYSHNTVNVYRNRLRTFSNSDDELFTTAVANVRRNGAGPSTVASFLAAFKAYCVYTDNVTELEQLNRYRAPSQFAPVPHPLPNGMVDVEKMLANCSGPVRVAIALGAFAGLRISETRSVTTDCLLQGHLTINGKGDKLRRVPISKALQRVLDEEISAPGLLVPMCDRWIRTKISRVANDSGVFHDNGEQVSSHDLRATFATMVYEKTGDILTVSRLLGHSSVTTTQIYLGINERAMAMAVEL